MAFCLNWALTLVRGYRPALDDDSVPFGRGKRVRLVKKYGLRSRGSLTGRARTHIGESRDDLIKWERMGRNFRIRDKLRDLPLGGAFPGVVNTLSEHFGMVSCR